MPVPHASRLLLLTLAVLGTACTERPSTPTAETQSTAAEPACEDPEARAVVERLGGSLKQVSLLAPDSVVVRTMREVYAPLVTPDLLAAWVSEPARAPGREVSSPWPERIEVRSVEPAEEGGCRVEGVVVYVTSMEVEGEEAVREPVSLRVREDGGWRISAYETAPTPPPDAVSAATDAADVIRRYYAAINAGDFQRAYALWGSEGAASGQTFEAFAAGFAETARVEVEIGEPGRVEPAAGSRYVAVPVVVRAKTEGGAAERFEGTYTLRRAVVPGASAAERRWHLYAADIVRVR